IAGSAGGRQLKGLPQQGRRAVGAGSRPTSDLVRGAIFSSLASLDADLSRVLDLYAGTGALGIEALSRGAAHCDFVERESPSCEVIRENLRLTGFEEQAQVICLAAERALVRLRGKYTLVLADPPYGDVLAGSVMSMLAASPLLEEGESIIVLEHGAKEEPAGALGPFALANSRRHGDSAFSVYR
ncbi:MAG: RsmD family RNA methyltransferase, partial [bacterium]